MGHNGPLPAAADIPFFIFLSAVFGLTPFVLHSVICFIAARFLTSSRLAFVAAGGLLGILALVVPFHVADCYALYGPGRLNSTFRARIRFPAVLLHPHAVSRSACRLACFITSSFSMTFSAAWFLIRSTGDEDRKIMDLSVTLREI